MITVNAPIRPCFANANKANASKPEIVQIALLALVCLLCAVRPAVAQTAPAGITESTLYKFCLDSGCSDGSNPYGGLAVRSGIFYGTTKFGGANGAGAVYRLELVSGKWTETVIYSFCSLANCADGEEPVSALTFDSAGNLYGTTSLGGTYCPNNQSIQCGVVFKLSLSKGVWTETVLHAFGGTNTYDGNFPVGGVVIDKSGNVYGTTSGGGDPTACSLGCGMVYELSPSGGSWTETVIHYFALSGASDPVYPSSGLTIDGSGNLYGTTSNCTSTCAGAIYKLAATSWTESILYKFTASNQGEGPQGGLILDSSGNLYGTTYSGGKHNFGVVFKLPPTGKEVVLHAFAGAPDGRNPEAGLAMDSSGNLYGTTQKGGSSTNCLNGCGTFFMLAEASAWKETRFNFSGTNGSSPAAGVVMSNGNFYGTTSSSTNSSAAGVAYKIVP